VTDIHDSSWLGVQKVARRLACSSRRVYQLVDEGVLPAPSKRGYRNFWSELDLQVCESRRRLPRKAPSGHQGRERKKDRAELARAFFVCWEAAGLALAVKLVKAEGVDHPGQIPRGVHTRLSHALRTAAALGYRGL
jgi:hypothetical protein